MAAGRKRGAAYNRQKQLKLFTGYLLAFLGIFAGVFLLILSWADPGSFNILRTTAQEATAPAGRTIAASRAGASSTWDNITAYFDAASKNAAMKDKLEKSETELIAMAALKAENKRLRDILGLVKKEEEHIATTRLIASTPTSVRRFALIGAGSSQGVERGQPVRSAKGLIGRTMDSSLNISQILLLTDPGNVVPVKRVEDDIVAFTQGRSDGRVEIRLINVGINPFKKGDIVVTSGNGGLYPPNIPVARVAELTDEGAIGELLAHPEASDYVIVLSPYRPEIIAAKQDGTPLNEKENEQQESDTAEQAE